MTEKQSRPLSVWFTQIFTALFFGACLLAMVSVLRGLISGTRSAGMLGLMLSMTLASGLAVLFGAAFWGLMKRRKYGRWLGVVSMSLIFLIAAQAHFDPLKKPQGLVSYDSQAEWFGGLLGLLFLLVLPLRLAFSTKVGAFFESQNDSP